MASFLSRLFKSSKKPKNKLPELVDIDKEPLQEGDSVESLRYELGRCTLILEEGKYYYQSEMDGRKMIWVKMIDASTDTQKVRKVKS